MGCRALRRFPSVAMVLLSLACVTEAAAQTEPERIEGRPNLNGVWQAIGTAHWNLEGHSAEALPEFWRLGAIGAVPAGQSVLKGGGKIPYLPEASRKREENQAGWPANDPEAKCYQPGIPRATYLPYPFRIAQGVDDILFAYEFASANRVVHMGERVESPIESFMGWSNGRWEDDTLVVEVTDFNGQTWLDRAGNHHSNELNHIEYEATLEDPLTFSEPWTISMPLYRRVDDGARVLEYKCVEFAEELLYGHLKKVEED
jgi:hypothetical protein